MPTTIAAGLAAPVLPTLSSRRGAGLGEVRWDSSGFWGRRQAVNAAHTFAHCIEWMERLGWLENFDRVARGELTVERAGWQFSDSEVYKLLEGIAWELARGDDAALESAYAGLVARVAAAQDADGYLGTAFGHAGLAPRYSDMSMGHELYNVGHLLQAAVARLRTFGDDALVEVARRAADHVCREFAPGARESVCGHPEIEVGLAEFGRATGESRYIEQARVFVERRGRGTLPVRVLLTAEYFQDDTPVREAEVLRGHAVRALYLAAGAADVAVETDDVELLEALRGQWERTVSRRTYLTGGMGSRHQDEGFGDDFELPPDRAYCETCAGVASVMFSWRLYLATGDVEYADLIERTLFNVIATGPREDGRAFFYANPLHVRELAPPAVADAVNMRAEGGVRAPWFDVSCCPTNVARTLASLETYAVSVDPRAVTLLQYSPGDVVVETVAGTVHLRVDTRYPDDGRVEVTVVEAPTEGPGLRLRVPAWASATGSVTGAEPQAVPPGWWDATAALASGQTFVLDMDLSPRLTWPDRRIDAVRGTVAIERGPLVLCLESTDLPAGVALDAVSIDPSAELEAHGDGARLRGAVVRCADAYARLPYGPATRHVSPEAMELTAIPYHRWAERGPATMRVFVPVTSLGREG